MASELKIKQTVRGDRKHQYWSNEQLEFLFDKLNRNIDWSKKEKIMLAQKLGVDY